MSSEKKVVISGASGFIGQELGLALVRHGYRIIALTRHPKKHSGRMAFPCTLIRFSEDNTRSIEKALAGASVILADEPTAALDAQNGMAVMELPAEVAKDTGRGVLAVTHDHRTLEYADRIIRIEDGRIVGRARRRDGEMTETPGVSWGTAAPSHVGHASVIA
jgi:ABC-type transporter Mla maintaining outer membrane lipid asymmetry ATPase subunit MlaF